ncbi:RapZ C-terminal domain-containing protein [Actinomadura litoris]|uniref:RapZ C-terminal domain-containing protein n=1 Tax=Actinomadura litoris TaxID=2678616 RepID=A0A7K1LAJ9_9ACTN|nr:RNase adapter RapZ [Actinomadura litoris]MUN41449.1 hypothetical protein [Actinomadura litoris]
MTVHLVSFGYLHGPPPPADHVEDLRHQLADPAGYHRILALLEVSPVDGRDQAVREVVLADSAAAELLDRLYARACAPGTASIGLGCSQGHDRSVAVAELLAARLRESGRLVTVEHLHVQRPRIRHTPGSSP